MLRDGTAMAITITTLSGEIIDCDECSGVMERSDPPFSGDFNENGIFEPFCHDCGGGFKRKKNGIVATWQSTYIESMSDKRLLDIHHSICTRSCQPWLRSWMDKQNFLMKIRNICHSRRDIIDFYMNSPYNENNDFLEQKISIF